jgi:Zn-dependent M28 family amino/carboxypeptidase
MRITPRLAVVSFASAALLGGCSSQPSARAAASAGDPAARWWAHVEALANDDMRGRETGSPEHRKAADYVSARFREAGLEPAGTDGFLQAVSFKSRKIVEAQSSLALVSRGTATPVTLGDEAAFGMRIDPAPTVDAPLVFAGHGLQIPELSHDDFAGLDAKGKVIVHIGGAPSNVPGSLAAHYQHAAQRAALVRKLGALGVITIPNPKSMDVPWERSSPNRLNPAMALAAPGLDDSAGQKVSITFNPARAERLFEGSGHTFAEMLKIADEGKALPRFPLPLSMRATVAVENTAVESHNVAGVLKGSDAALAGEYVVLTAHLDHVGVGAPINGDAIYNGAMDNASGIATLIETAKVLSAAKPKRSVVFVAVTGEEKGLLGSRYYSLNPTVPKAGMVANLNIDMFLPLWPLKILTVFGLNESDLTDDVSAVAKEMGLTTQPDPQPQRNRFIRSDQYSFIREGVPALVLKVGALPGSPEEKIEAEWTRVRYHGPADDLTQPVDRAAAVAYTDAIGRLALRIANRPTRPAWKADSFFRRFEK